MKNSKEWFAKAFMEAEKLDCLTLKSENETK
ncbi:unknown [Clostridium sp. CAG:678]|nr:unknown [Clostridium sp. CAG:678]